MTSRSASRCLSLSSTYSHGRCLRSSSAAGPLSHIMRGAYARQFSSSGSRALSIYPSKASLKRTWLSSMSSFASRSFATSSSLPGEKRYSDQHEWIELSEDGTYGTIGVSEYAAKALGDVVYVELPVVENEVNAGDAIGAVESVKSASDIYSPISGTVVEANSVLEDKPGTINSSAETDGWIAKIKLNEGEAEKVTSLMDAGSYAKFTEE